MWCRGRTLSRKPSEISLRRLWSRRPCRQECGACYPEQEHCFAGRGGLAAAARRSVNWTKVHTFRKSPPFRAGKMLTLRVSNPPQSGPRSAVQGYLPCLARQDMSIGITVCSVTSQPEVAEKTASKHLLLTTQQME